MIEVSERYMKECDNPTRNSYVVAKYGLYNKEAKSLIYSMLTSNIQPFSDRTKTYDEVKDTTLKYISCEPNRVKLNGSFAFIQNKNDINILQNIGYWSSELSNENGIFEEEILLTYNFIRSIDFVDLTLYFDEIIKDFSVTYYDNERLVHNKEYKNNDKLIVETDSGLSSTYKFNKLVITIKSTLEPYRYAKLLEIDFGKYEILSREEIENIEIIDEISIDSSDMPSNSCTLTIKDLHGDYDFLNPYNKIKNLQEKQEVNVYHYLKIGTIYKEVLLGSYLIKNINYEKKKLILECYDDRFFMNKIYYGSHFYINEDVKKVFKDLFDYFGYEEDKYSIDQNITDRVTGYVGNVEEREALRLICESCKAICKKSRQGKIEIYQQKNNGTVKLFKVKELENSMPTKNLYNNLIDIKEYSYTLNDELVEIYNGVLSNGVHNINYEKYPIDETTLSIEQTNIQIVSISATSCSIYVQNDNTNVILKAKVYNVGKTTKRISKAENLEIDEYAIQNVDNTLITSDNSRDIAIWKLDRNEIKYSFETNAMPYIEVGDNCKMLLEYKTLDGSKIKRDFIPTRIELNLGIKETIEGE